MINEQISDELLPAFSETSLAVSKFLFISLLIGFISHHVVEKEIYKHNKKQELIKMLSLEENVFYFFYHIILGFVFVSITRHNFIEGLFFFVSISAYTLASNLPATHHKSKKTKTLLLSTSTFIGALIATFIISSIALWIELMLIGFVTGVLLFTITRHHIPYGRKGSIGYFTLGFLIYAFFIIAKWIF